MNWKRFCIFFNGDSLAIRECFSCCFRW